jgi:putative phosphoesterase
MTQGRPFIGVISDTHGLLRDEVLSTLDGAELIIHAGDVVRLEDLPRLKQIAPTVVVKGNMDRATLPKFEVFDHRDRRFAVLHSLEDLDVDPVAAEVNYVIHGHTHVPDISELGGVIYLNPGSCGPERRNKPVTVAKIWLDEDWAIEVIEL